MLEPVTDYKQRIVCYADATTGLIESKYKKQTTRTVIPVGGTFNIVREDTETEIIRISATAFDIRSFPAVA